LKCVSGAKDFEGFRGVLKNIMQQKTRKPTRDRLTVMKRKKLSRGEEGDPWPSLWNRKNQRIQAKKIPTTIEEKGYHKPSSIQRRSKKIHSGGNGDGRRPVLMIGKTSSMPPWQRGQGKGERQSKGGDGGSGGGECEC